MAKVCALRVLLVVLLHYESKTGDAHVHVFSLSNEELFTQACDITVFIWYIQLPTKIYQTKYFSTEAEEKGLWNQQKIRFYDKNYNDTHACCFRATGIYIKQKCLSVSLFVCPSRLEGWGWGAVEGDGEGGQERGG